MPASTSSILRGLNVVLCGLTFAAYSASYFSPFTFWPLAFLGLVYPWLALANLFFILYWALSKKKVWVFLSFITLLAGWTHLRGLIGLPAFGKEAAGSEIRVVSYNVRRFQPYGQGGARMIGEKEWAESVANHRPDILCIQEFDSGPFLHASNVCREAGLRYQAGRDNSKLVLFSRFPIIRTGSQMFNSIYGFHFADLQIGNQVVRVYNVHLQSNAITGIATRVVEKGDLKEKRTWKDIRGMLGRYRRAARTREEQAGKIAGHIQKAPYPVILCGDLNDVPQSFVYHRIRGGLKDAFQSGGRGLGVTYAGPLPGLRIDVILAESSFDIQSCRIGKREFSDHRPVIAIMKP